MRQTPRFLYEKVYCARGDVENRIKELKDLQLDRTSCCRLRANQLRVFLTAAAYVLMQELRLHAARTACARTQVMWLRDRLLKLSVHVVSSVRRLVLHLPRSTPNLDAWSLLGAAGERIGYDRSLKANTVKRRTHSLFRQGLMLYHHLPNWPEDRIRPLMETFGSMLMEQRVYRELFGVI